MGKPIERKLGKSSLTLRNAYETYLMCRTTQLQVFRKPTGRRDGSEKIATVVWPSGFSTLPKEGGWDQQDYLMTRLLAAARSGEEQGAAKMMAKP